MSIVIYKGEKWKKISTHRSILNGSKEYLLRRESDGLVTVACAGRCASDNEPPVI